MDNYNEIFKKRTKAMALEVLSLYREWEKTDEIRIIGKQLLRSATSTAANYRAVIRARSNAERYHKLCIVVEEADESLFWLEVLHEGRLVEIDKISPLISEVTEIVKVMSSYRNKYKPKK